MRKFLEEHEYEVLLILVAMLGVTRWWSPAEVGFDNIYAASHWTLSYEHGFLRRGLVGSIVQLWMPGVGIATVRNISLVAYCTLLVSLLPVIYNLLKHKDIDKRLFRLLLLLTVTPSTFSFLARFLGSYDLFLILITFCCMALLSVKKLLWLVPVLLGTAMLIHEGFLVMFAPTIMATMLFIYFFEGRERRMLAAFVASFK